MTTIKKFLTKSKFKTGHDCPSKLFFVQDKKYGSTNDDNDFLKALAEGGFQVGELAKIYHPNGINIESLDKTESIEQTKELLKKDKVTIYEPAFSVGGLFVRVDILEKHGNSLKLFEVKSKSFDFSDLEASFFQKRNPTKIAGEWESYLLDVAFQAYVVKKAYPQFNCTWHLKLTDTSKVSTVDGLNQRFLILPQNKTNARIETAPDTNAETVGLPILGNKNVDAEIKALWAKTDYPGDKSFDDYVESLLDVYDKNIFAKAKASSSCKACEYRIGSKQKAEGLLSGFDKCFSDNYSLSTSQLEKPFVFDIRFFGKKSEDFLNGGKFLIEQMDPTHLDEKERDDDKSGWSRSQRQRQQLQMVQGKLTEPLFLKDELAEELQSWKKPYHFIDFETSKVALPFNKGRRPYEEMAFQFSHHIVDEAGNIEHAGQYLNLEKGKFPNFDFVRALKKN